MPFSSLSSLYPLMRDAAREARRFMGATSPNPPVGAIALDSGGQILAIAAHQKAGQDHAEAAMLKLCRERGTAQRLHTVIVTLEPCNHHGRTPPCSDALIAAGVRRVLIGQSDPNPQVIGGGAEKLRQAGIEVIENVESDLCAHLLHAFAYRAHTGWPFVTVKRAFDENGSMIPPPGLKTFTSPASLTLAHRIRKKADAILTGSGTILADNPSFTVRHVPDHPGKTRYLAILDRRARVPETYLTAAEARGFIPLVYDKVETALLDLKSRGVQDIMVEAGPQLSQYVVDNKLYSLRVDVKKGAPDKIEAALSPEAQQLTGIRQLDLELLLPL